MRLICTLNDQKKGYILSNYLKSQGIDNEYEVITNTDWGSSEYGNLIVHIWVYEEELMDKALEITSQFLKEPDDSRYQVFERQENLFLEPLQKKIKETQQRLNTRQNEFIMEKYPLGILTFYLLIVCILIFMVDLITFPTVTIERLPEVIPLTPIYTSPLYKQMMYDYPKAYEIVDKIVKNYGIEKLQNPSDLPPEAISMLKQLAVTPFWKGYYNQLVNRFNKKKERHPQQAAPLFEKIRQGEVWRIFTPCLLHYNSLHLFFNMIWLAILGKPMEKRLGIGRYSIFILITGIVSNTCQYLMGGPNFLGFSGVLCGMLTFIWSRLRYAAWEGYPLQKASINFTLFFILMMFGIQFISFFIEIYSNVSLSPGIANTAHLSGAFCGLVFGRMNYFSIKR